MNGLTERQDKFAYDVGALGKTQIDAYRAHYSHAGWETKKISDAASLLAAKPKVAERIAELKAKRAQSAERQMDMTVKRLMETYIAIAFVDPNELISVRVGCCRHCYGEGGGYQWRELEFLDACRLAENKNQELPDIAGGFGYRHTRPPVPTCEHCDGEGVTRLRPMDTTQLSPGALHLYRGAQQTKDGIKILFGDKDKALDQIGRMLGAYDDKLRVDLQGKIASLKLTTTDPNEAAQAYAKMISGG